MTIADSPIPQEDLSEKELPKHKRHGLPKYVPNDEQRNLVAIAAASGMRQSDIARALAVDEKTLRKHFKDELTYGHDKVMASVKMTAYQMALSGQQPSMTIFVLKTQGGWRETVNLAPALPQSEEIVGQAQPSLPAPRQPTLIVPRIPSIEEWTKVTQSAQEELLRRASQLIEGSGAVVDVQ